MRILIDECVDRRVAAALKGLTVRTVPQHGWAGLKNGQLLSKAQHEFDVFVTVDQNLSHQHKLTQYNIRIAVLRAKTNTLSDLLPLIAKLQRALSETISRQVFIIE